MPIVNPGLFSTLLNLLLPSLQEHYLLFIVIYLLLTMASFAYLVSKVLVNQIISYQVTGYSKLKSSTVLVM